MEDIDQLLEDWQVQEIDYEDLRDREGADVANYLRDWYTVSNTRGIIAYFGSESDALRFRLGEINRRLNG